MEYKQAYFNILSRLERTRRKETGVHLLSSLLWVGALSLTLYFVLALLELFAHASTQLRTLMFSVWCVSTLSAFAWYVGRELWSRVFAPGRPGVESIALRIGAVYADLRDTLLNAMQLLPLVDSAEGISTQLVYASFHNAEEQARSKDFDQVIDYSGLRRKALIFISVAVAFVSLCSFSPLGSAAYRLLHFQQSFVPPAPFQLHIEPLNLQVLHGQKVVIKVRVSGTSPQTLTLQVREEQQQNLDAYTLREDSLGYFHFELTSVKRSMDFYAEVPWYSEHVRSDTGHIVVTDRPLIRSLEGSVQQPAYTGLAPLSLSEQNADINCLVGSRVDLRIQANKDIQSARLVMSGARAIDSKNSDTTSAPVMQDTSSIQMNCKGREASASFSVRRSGQYWIELLDAQGRSNVDPIHYSINALTDGYPAISLVEPQADVQLKKDALLAIRASITDDYGFSQLVIRYRLAESRYAEAEKDFKSISMPLNSSGTSAEVPYLWDLNKQGISPDDRFEFYLEVFDNDRISGPKSAKTSVLSLRLPSLDEVFRQAEQRQSEATKDLEKVLKKADDVAREMEQLQRELMKQKQPQADWKEKKKMEDLLKQQEQIQEKLKDVQEKLEDMTQMLQENKALSPETMQKYAEMQKLLKSIDSKELRKAMEQMQKAMEQMSPEQLQQAMKNFKFNEEDFKKQIERTMQLLKRIQTEQKVDELAKRAEELQKQQEDLQKQAENTNPNDKDAREQLAKKQEAMKDDMKRLTQEMKDLEKMAKEAGLEKQQNVMDEMKKAMDELNAEMTQKQMEQSEKDLEQGDMQSASKNMRNAEQNLKNFSQGMKKMKQEMKKNLQKETTRQMQSSLNDMMSLSKAEEQLMKEAEQMDMNSARMSENARQQQKVREQMMNLANRLNQLGQKTTAVSPEMGKEMGDAMRQMQNAQESLENRNSQMASQQQRGAMSSMNKAMQQMSGALQKMGGGSPGGEGADGEGDGDPMNPGGSKPGSSGSFMQRLQQAANTQQGINQGMQQLGQSGGQGLSQQQQGELGRLAAQQGKVQKTLEELAKEQKETSGNKQALGSLEKLAEEMREVLSDMQSGRVSEDTRRRQDRILSRLLDASRSMNERDYEKTRESRSGEDQARKSPAELKLDELRNKQAVQDLLKSMQQGYSKDYEQLIRQYFERLQKGAQQ